MNAGPGAAGTVAGLSPAGVPRAPAREPVLLAAAPQRHQRDTASVIVALAAGFDGPDPGAVTRRAQGTGWLLAYLAEFPGQSWQDRWIASGLEDGGPLAVKAIVCQALGIEPATARIYCVTAGLGALLALDVVRPGLGYMLGLRLSKLLPQLITWRRDPDEDILRAAPASAQSRSHAAAALGRLLVLTGRPVASLTAQDLLTYRTAVLQRRTQTVGLEHLWSCLQRRGQVDGTLRQALRPGQKTVTQLVGNYPIRSDRVRGLLIAYLTERSLTVDYSTLRALVQDLCHLYWLAVESIAPGIDTIDLPPEVAVAWKEQLRWRLLPGGQRVPRRNALNTLMTVRGFYADLLQLAYDDPARWAQWPCAAPVSANEVKRYHKWRGQLRSEMHERTRVRAVSITSLADAAERRYHQARVLYDTAHGLPCGGGATIAGTAYVRVDAASHPLAHPRLATITPDGAVSPGRFDVVQDEEDAFWGLAIVEVLRHTGIRIEEMLELTQLDVHEYDHRDPAVGKVLLLHVNPSKLDQERMVVIAPELAAVLASITRRIRHATGTTGTALPSLVLYDYAECQNSEPLPFFFQRTAGKGFKGTTRPITKGYVSRVLARVCAAAGLTGPDGAAIAFTAHDFRRVFATDALAAGLPPHIIQKLMGHASITTTQGYAAIFPDDVIRAHRAFNENRRKLRPADEYRDVTSTEWSDFEDHFAKRKIAIGDCMRAYGTSCVHEYACEQCKLARPDPGAKPRLQRTRDSLHEQAGEARERGWHGETERLTYIIAGIQDKLDQIERSERRATIVQLDPPRIRHAPENPQTSRL
ncbi:MAG TPA: site-specific integrase [Streptosporangiaceae bacterium]|nr:site-specific integrase [Streptosporangiaceae bacterium]